MASLLVGCAAGGDPGDGGANLPDRGFGTYERVLDADEAAVAPVVAEGRRLGAPMAVVEGGRVALYFEVCADDICDVGRAESSDGIAFGDWQTVAEDMRAPYVIRRGSGWDLYGVRGDGIVRAEGDGVTFGAAVEVARGEGVGSPSVVEHGGRRVLYATRPLDDGGELVRAVEAGEGFGEWQAVAVPGTPEGWDPGEVAGAEVRSAVTDAGRAVLRLVYAGDGDLGFAASYDGEAWSAYAFNPALEGGRAPSNVRLGGRYLLYFERTRGGLGVAVREADNPSERF